MQLRASRKLFAAALVAGLTFVTAAPGSGDLPPLPSIPVAPTVLPPVPPAGHLVRFQNLVPAQPVKPGEPEKPDNGQVVVEAGPELSLGECIAVAVERHPALKAERASMGATESGFRSLTKFGTVGTLLSPDLEIRKQQAQRGLAAAAGGYQKVHNETVQDVTRLYYTAVYAKQQHAIASDVVGQLRKLIEIGEDILKNTKDIKDLQGFNQNKLLAMKVGLRQALQLEAKARIGQQQALAALRQVMNVDDQCFPFRVKDAALPVMEQTKEITKNLVVCLAVERRPELALAAAGVDVFRLEVYAQGRIPFKRVVPTFASGADLHAKEIPQPMRGKEYRPGGVTPEMPTQLVGSKYDRVNRAMAFSQKADAVFESARSLIVLEAENAFFEFELASEGLRLAREQLDLAVELQKNTRDNAENIKQKDLIVQVEVLAAKAQSDYVEAVFNHLLALAALERITAGAIRPQFPGR